MSTYIEVFNYSVNLLQALLWQYDQAESLTSLVALKQLWYQEEFEDFWSEWYTNVFNLETCNQFGLQVWSIILNIPNYISTSSEPINSPYIFGFNAYDPAFPDLENTYTNFFGSTSSPSIGGNFSDLGTTRLQIEEQRFLLRVRYYQLVSNGNPTAINVFLNWLTANSPAPVAGNTVYCVDNFDMTIEYVFSANFPLELSQALQLNDLMPRPAGVGVTYTTL